MGLVITRITKIVSNKGLIMIAAMICGFVMFISGPSKVISESNIYIMAVGQCIVMGFGLSFLVPIIPEMIESTKDSYPGHMIRVSDLSSGIFNTSLSMGSAIGPILGQTVNDIVGF